MKEYEDLYNYEWDFTPDREKMLKIHDLLKTDSYTPKKAATELHFSYDLTLRYMNVLYVLGAIAWDHIRGCYSSVYCQIPSELASYSYYKEQLMYKKYESLINNKRKENDPRILR